MPPRFAGGSPSAAARARCRHSIDDQRKICKAPRVLVADQQRGLRTQVQIAESTTEATTFTHAFASGARDMPPCKHRGPRRECGFVARRKRHWRNWIARGTSNPEVAGSNPAWRMKRARAFWRARLSLPNGKARTTKWITTTPGIEGPQSPLSTTTCASD